jgi:uncharacterized protein (DUF58 family)
VNTGAARLPDPALLARIGDLELVARIVADGLVSGLHRSPFHGYSAEFSQYRHYRPGDDLKYVDWKLAARTGRVYTKQFRETTNMAASLVVDTSRSMAFPDGAASKLRYAIVSAAALAHLVAMQGDDVGIVARDVYVGPRAGRQHLRRVLATLGALQPAEWHAAETIRLAAERMKRRGLLMVFSDLYDDEEGVFGELRRASRLGHEVVLFQVMSRDEMEFAYRGDVELVDLETGRTLAVDAPRARAGYRDAVSAFVERWRRRAGSEGFQYTLMLTDAPHDRALRNFLLARR